ncbi:MAG: carbohydrate ABC transporter permease, partial [Candidatus Acetothermia bacterium]
VLTVLAGSLAAYSFERFDATFLPNLYLTTRMIPPVVMIIPTYLGAYLLGILDTYFLLIFLYSALNMALIAWLLRDFFSKIPRELEEAAMIDGCTRLQSLRKVILPLVRPGLIASGLICFIFTWNEFIFALTLTGDRTRTLPVLVSTFITQRGMDRGLMAAASIIASIPIILVTMFFSRHLISGLTKGSTK